MTDNNDNDDGIGMFELVLIAGMWGAALIEPTPIGEGIALTVTMALLGADEEGGA